METFVNYTGADLKVVGDINTDIFPSLGCAIVEEKSVVKYKQSHCDDSSCKEYEVRDIEYGDIIGLPPPIHNTKIIVSAVVMSANEKSHHPRNDLVRSDTGRTCKRVGNTIEYVTGFVASSLLNSSSENPQQIDESTSEITNSSQIINLTPHIIRLRTGNSSMDHDFSSQGIARVNEESFDIGTHAGHVIRHIKYTDIIGLPELQDPSKKYIVSWFVTNANRLSPNPRTDLIRPDSGPTSTKDEKNQIYSVTGFTL